MDIEMCNRYMKDSLEASMSFSMLTGTTGIHFPILPFEIWEMEFPLDLIVY